MQFILTKYIIYLHIMYICAFIFLTETAVLYFCEIYVHVYIVIYIYAIFLVKDHMILN